MAFFNRFPYTNYNDINLDWIIDRIKKLTEKVEQIDTSVDTGLDARVTVVEGEVDQLQNEVETPSTGLLDRMTAAEGDITTLQNSLSDTQDVYWIDFVNLDADEVQRAWDAYHAGKLLVCDVLGQLFVQEYILDMTVMKLWAMSDSGGLQYVRYLSIFDFSPFYTLDSHYLMFDKDVTAVVAAGDTDLITSGGVYDALQTKQDTLTFDATPTSGSTNPVDSDGIYAALQLKQDVLTLDATPTDGSTNAVESNGVYDALQLKQDTLTFDAVPTQNSTNPVESGGVYQAILDASFAGVTFDNDPTDGSSNPVTSNGIYDALKGLIAVESYQVVDAASDTIAADSSTEYSQDVTKVGYTAIGVVGKTITGTNSDHLVFNRLYIGTNIAYMRIMNPTASAVTLGNVRLWVLYVKTMA